MDVFVGVQSNNTCQCHATTKTVSGDCISDIHSVAIFDLQDSDLQKCSDESIRSCREFAEDVLMTGQVLGERKVEPIRKLRSIGRDSPSMPRPPPKRFHRSAWRGFVRGILSTAHFLEH